MYCLNVAKISAPRRATERCHTFFGIFRSSSNYSILCPPAHLPACPSAHLPTCQQLSNIYPVLPNIYPRITPQLPNIYQTFTHHLLNIYPTFTQHLQNIFLTFIYIYFLFIFTHNLPNSFLTFTQHLLNIYHLYIILRLAGLSGQISACKGIFVIYIKNSIQRCLGQPHTTKIGPSEAAKRHDIKQRSPNQG